MKRHVKKMGLTMLWSLAFIMGGMFLANDLQAQVNQSTVIQLNAPNGKDWVSTQQAILTVQGEITFLTNLVQQMLQQGADPKLIKVKKGELHFYMLLQEGLNAGFSVSRAMDYAFAKIGGSDTSPKSEKAKLGIKGIYDAAVAKLSI